MSIYIQPLDAGKNPIGDQRVMVCFSFLFFSPTAESKWPYAAYLRYWPKAKAVGEIDSYQPFIDLINYHYPELKGQVNDFTDLREGYVDIPMDMSLMRVMECGRLIRVCNEQADVLKEVMEYKPTDVDDMLRLLLVVPFLYNNCELRLHAKSAGHKFCNSLLDTTYQAALKLFKSRGLTYQQVVQRHVPYKYIYRYTNRVKWSKPTEENICEGRDYLTNFAKLDGYTFQKGYGLFGDTKLTYPENTDSRTIANFIFGEAA